MSTPAQGQDLRGFNIVTYFDRPDGHETVGCSDPFVYISIGGTYSAEVTGSAPTSNLSGIYTGQVNTVRPSSETVDGPHHYP